MGNEEKQLQNNLNDEAVRVELTSRAGGYKTRNLVKQAEEMLANQQSVQK